MEINENQFIEGFNSGYLLKKYEPLVLSEILKINSSNSYILGIGFGAKEYINELSNSQLSELNLIRDKARDNREKDFK